MVAVTAMTPKISAYSTAMIGCNPRSAKGACVAAAAGTARQRFQAASNSSTANAPSLVRMNARVSGLPVGTMRHQRLRHHQTGHSEARHQIPRYGRKPAQHSDRLLTRFVPAALNQRQQRAKPEGPAAHAAPAAASAACGCGERWCARSGCRQRGDDGTRDCQAEAAVRHRQPPRDQRQAEHLHHGGAVRSPRHASRSSPASAIPDRSAAMRAASID